MACGILNNSFGNTLRLELGCGEIVDEGVASEDGVEMVWLEMATFVIGESDLVGLSVITEIF